MLKRERAEYNRPAECDMFSEEVPGFRERYRENVVEVERLSASEMESRERPFRFLDLPPHEARVVDAVLRGRCAINDLPPLGHRVVRLFVSATFTGRCSRPAVAMSWLAVFKTATVSHLVV